MCGINGIYNFSGRNLPSQQLIQKMNQCVAHRGPDDEGIWTDKSGKVHFGHRRLSIIDLSPAGHQPMTDHAGNAIIFNGEIYNYREIRNEMKPYAFHSESDTEVLLELCKRRFLKGIDRLNGMFAFAYWDENSQKLLLVRDRIGKKPLFYTETGGVLYFASELRSLLEIPEVQKSVNPRSLYHFLTYNQVAAPDTIFNNIYKLPAAGFLVAGKNGIEETDIYWDVEYTDLNDSGEEHIADNILSLLKSSVNYRMVADVPVGAFLSGGVDSASIVALMHESGQKIKTYSAGFQGMPDYTELKYAEKIAKKFNTEHFEVIMQPDDIREFITKLADIFDEPLSDPTAIPIYFLSKLARQNGTIVVQTGDGSDELFSGYRNWKKYATLYPWFRNYSKLPSVIKKSVAAALGKSEHYSPWKEFFHRAAGNEEFFWGGAKSFKESHKKKLLNDQFRNFNSYEVIVGLRKKFANNQPVHATYIDWMCYLGLKQQVPERYLYRMDKLGMANSVEVRCPFLDVSLVNYAMSVPAEFKIKNNTPKYILKKSLEGILDHEILYRKKMGFNVPLKEWAYGTVSGYVSENLHAFCEKSGIFDEVELRNMVKQSDSNKELSNNLFTLYFLMAWYDKWIN